MNSQNHTGKNTRPRPTMPENSERFIFPGPQGGVMDPFMMGAYYMQPQMQMMLKWRNQMAHLVRNSPDGMQNSYPYMEPPPMHGSYLGGDFSGMMPPPCEPVFDQTRKDYPNYSMKMNEGMFPFNPYAMIPPSMSMPMMPNKPHYKLMRNMTPNYPHEYPYQQKRRPIQRERPPSIMPNKEPHVIVIDEDQDVIPEVIEKKPEVIQMIQEIPPVPQKEINRPQLITQKIARMTAPATNLKLVSKKVSKPITVQRVSSDEKIEEDSFKPSGFRSKKIEKKKIKVQRERAVRHRETDRQRVLKEKKTIQEEKVYSSKPNDQQGKIMISSFHQAKIPEYRFGQPEYEKQKERKRQSLKERFQFQGSLYRDQYKRIKESLNSWPTLSLINVVKNKFSSQCLANQSIEIIQDSDQKILESANTFSSMKKKDTQPLGA